MIGTFFSLLFGIFLFLHPFPRELLEHSPAFPVALLFISLFFIFIAIATTLYAWMPLQKLEQNFMPKVIEAFRKDRNLKISRGFLFLFFLLSYAMAFDVLFLGVFNKSFLLITWSLFLGIAVDLLLHYLKRTMEYLDPYHIMGFFSKSAQDCIRNTQESELCDFIDTFSETSLKAITKNSTALAMLTVENLELIAKNYLTVAKGITYHNVEDEKKFGGSDHVSYTLFYLFQRFELIFDKALAAKQEPISSKIVTTLGKISVYSAKYDISLMGYPIFYLGRFTSKAQREGMQEVGNRAMLTLTEISKVIIKEVDLKYTEIKDPFLTLINTMQSIAKDSFRNDKTTNIRLLMQPFYELRALFQGEKLNTHQDTPSLLHNIDIVIQEFATLESVMNTMPPIPEIIKERATEENETTP